ncbi:MAG: C69 family dipeptidase [Proteobacteria bacterium]|nr:C69 family dipeptidase [Pseudomonadota bacterium]MBU1647827.1 C69 family dipeptidase [Pseudomonadota bacterium]
MKKLIVAVLAWDVIGAVSALACTTLLVTKEASKDGSVMVGLSYDREP